MAHNFDGKKVLITGAGQGIGRELVKGFAAAGASVFALSRTESNLKSLKNECPNITTITYDLSNLEKLNDAVKPHLPFHVLVNNAGVGVVQNFLELTPDKFDETINVNLKSVVFLSQIVAKSMIDNKIHGSIVHVSSQASMIPLQGHTSYTCSKAALDSLARSMALELGPHGIRTNCVNPTVVLTEMGRMNWGTEEKGGPMLKRIPLGKFADTDDVVNATMFLASDSAKLINGVALPVDGGFCAVGGFT